MGQRSLETVKEIEQTRDALDSKIQALEERIPPLSAVRRVAGLAVGGGVSGTVFWFAVRRVRARKRRKEEESQPVNAVINLIPDRLTERLEEAMEGERAKQWALGVAALWLIVKLAEIRQMRALRHAM
jgi:hypothetical protein